MSDVFVHCVTATVVFDERTTSIGRGGNDDDVFGEIVGRMNWRSRSGRGGTTSSGNYTKRRVLINSNKHRVACGAMSGMRLLLFLFGGVFVATERFVVMCWRSRMLCADDDARQGVVGRLRRVTDGG